MIALVIALISYSLKDMKSKRQSSLTSAYLQPAYIFSFQTEQADGVMMSADQALLTLPDGPQLIP